jgi:hypothetical protein
MWTFQMLNAFYVRTEGRRRNKFNTKLDAVEVCNACYATALGYSQRRFKQLKVAHQVYRRVAAVHGNMCNLKEGGQLCSAIDFIADEHHKGGCVPFCE